MTHDDHPDQHCGTDHISAREECADCDAIAAAYVLSLERDLLKLSVDLWIAGWQPEELVDEVRRSTDSDRACRVAAHLLIVDDSRRSAQDRTARWCEGIAALHDANDVSDVATGWVIRWATAQADPHMAARCLDDVARTLLHLATRSVDGCRLAGR